MVGDGADMRVALLQGAPFQELPKDLRLEYLDQLQLSAPLELKPLGGQELARRHPTNPYASLP